MQNKYLIKAKENSKAADLLAQNNMYNAATNRLYYSVFQKVLTILDLNNIKVVKTEESKGSHIDTAAALGDSSIIGNDMLTFISELHFIRDLRHKSDYIKVVISKDDYANIDNKATIVNHILDKHV